MTVQQLKALLSGTQPGSTFTLSDTALGITAVQQLFDKTLPSNTLTVAAAQPDATNLAVTGTITVGNAVNAPVNVTFAADATNTNVTGLLIDITEPGFTITTPFLNLTLDFLNAFQFQTLHLLLSAEPDALGVTAPLTGIGSSLQFSATNGTETLTFRGFTNPTVPDGDISFEGDFQNVSIADLTKLVQLIPGVTFSVPSNVPLASSIDLTKIIVGVSPSLGTITMAYIEVQSAAPWKIIPGKFEFDSLTVGFAVSLPTVSPALTATVTAVLDIEGVKVSTAITLPDLILTAELQDKVSLAPFIKHYIPGVTIDSFDISQFTVSLDINAQQYYCSLDITGQWTLATGVELDELFMTISGQGTIATGQIAATFNLGGTRVLIGAAYTGPSNGWTFSGSTVGDSQIPIGNLLNGAAQQFGVTLPGPISDLALQKILLTLTTGNSATGAGRAFTFTCEGTTTVSNVSVDFTPTIQLTYNATSKSWDGVFGGTLVLHSPPTGPSSKALTFTVKFSDTAADMALTATYQGTALGFDDFASAVGFTSFPAIPSNLDLGLTSAGFSYDFTKKSMVFGAGSSTYSSNAVFVTFLPTGTNPVRQYFFLLGINKTFSLSNLPLVGKELAAIENIEVADLMIVIGSEKADTTVIGIVNPLITAVFPSGYPTLVATTGTFVLTANMTFGADKEALNVSFGGASTQGLALTTTGASSDGTTWFNIQKSFGPVSIGRIGVMYQSSQQVLWFEIDATLAFGPLTLDLVGLGLGSPLTTFEPEFTISGLGVAYKNPPLEIAGSLVNLAPPGANYIEFEGGVTIGTGEFTLTAFGYYGDQNNFSSMFIFGDLAYDFGGPPAFFITGLALGFGYNSSLRIPTIDEVAVFPFVQVLPTSMIPSPGIFGTNPTPQKVLDAIMHPQQGSAWVTPQQGSLWFGAGITFTTYELVNSQALVLVTTGGSDGLVIALVGTSRAQFPQATGGEIPVYAYVELDLEVEFAPQLGVFSLQAVLAKSSFLLDKSCVLTGGFAFFVWFGNNAHAGDFVLTLGGYNPGFTPPAYYPVVPAVGFHWSLDSSITISGGAYFALTPSALMVGGELNATYQSGNLKAWFDAHADMIVQWKPFWFDAGFGITIGASYKVNLLFTSFTVSVELGCNLEIWGPPTGGTVGVDWYIISFSIPFGASKNASKPAINQWSDVQAMLPNSGAAAAPNVLTLAPSSGLAPNTTSPANGNPQTGPWVVRGSQFGFSTSSSIPASSATIGSGTKTRQFNGSSFNVAPLGWSGVKATHAVTIVDGQGNDYSSAFAAIPSQRNVPAQLWGSQQSSTPDGSAQLVPDQLTGTSVSVLPPEIGGSAGPVNVEVNLANINLGLANSILGVSASAQPAGDVAVASPNTVSIIADPNKGIASSTATAARNAVYTALQGLQYAPASNDPMTNFAQGVGCALAAEPLLVP